MPVYGYLAPTLRASRPTQRSLDAGTVFPAFVDTLFNYESFLKRVDRDYIATFPGGFPSAGEVAVVGSGQAGLVAAFELMRAGVEPVIYEATGRMGGRAWSEPFEGGNVFAEMGAMRFPQTAAFMHYKNRFGLQFGGQFPNPGEADLTLLYYQNTPYLWRQGDPPPGPFAQISTDWNNFVSNLGTDGLMNDLLDGRYNEVQPRWQQLVNKYANVSFLTAVANGIPKWGPEQLNAFGALGIGSGGFGPLYSVDFLELIRLLVNGLESEQQLLLNGISSMPQSFYQTRERTADGRDVSLMDLEALHTNHPVCGIEHRPGTERPVRLYFDRELASFRDFKSVIVATTTRSMQVMGMTLDIGGEASVDEEVKTALRNLHMMSSSKMFIRTETKFWLDDPTIPSNIQTDELPRGIYCLDYGERTSNGVVLISYTWGDDSTKLLAIDPVDRFEIFLESIHQIAPRFAEHLEPVDGEILNVDWQLEDFYYGAFKLQLPRQEADLRNAYYQFQSVDRGPNTGVFLAGDSVSWAGGWTEGALHSGLNAACAVARHLGGEVIEESPLDQDSDQYNYKVS